MVPIICQVAHKPPHSYGDCIRACVASILELTPDQVPHFYDDEDAMRGTIALRKWLVARGYAPTYFAYDATHSFDDIMEIMRENNPESIYMLICQSGGGNHCVIARGGEIIHDPAWYKMPIDGPQSEGFWVILVIGKI